VKLNAHDIRTLSFRKVLRGVDGEEVHAFLETVADQVEQRDAELAALKLKVAELEQQLLGYTDMETGLRDTLTAVQNSSHDSLDHARREGELIIKQAELDAGRITAEARERRAALNNELLSLEDQRTSFVIRLKALVKGQLDLLEVLAAVRPEPVRPEPVRSEPVRPEPVRPEPPLPAAESRPPADSVSAVETEPAPQVPTDDASADTDPTPGIISESESLPFTDENWSPNDRR